MLPLLAMIVTASGCAGTMLRPEDERGLKEALAEECRGYDSAHLGWQAVGIAAGGLGGAVGSGGVLAATLPDDPSDPWSIGLAAGSAVLGVLGAVASYLSGEYAVRFEDRCGEPTEDSPRAVRMVTPHADGDGEAEIGAEGADAGGGGPEAGQP